jgi:hypothetical protein
MAGEISAPPRARLSRRVRLVLVCALAVIVFLAVVTPGVFDVRHKKRSLEIKKPITRLVLDSKGRGNVEIKPSGDGHVHFLRTSEISKDSRLVERVQVSGKTLTIHSACTGSRLGILRRCDIRYRLRVPKEIALALRLHIGTITLHGLHGRLSLKLVGGVFRGFGCNKRAAVSLRFGSVEYRDNCVPEHFRAWTKGGDIALTVPAGRYDVKAGGKAKRPFANIIEDPSARNEIDADVAWFGSISIEGVRK